MESVKQSILTILRLYKRFLSPSLPPACRFFPSCAEYCYLAINRYGVWRGTMLSAKRLCKCHPFHAGGYDPLV
ncbi:MAG: membrane protein insertion efficiency factor YidD [Acidobacteria bacterium]|nr:membrane protein insertion efficiency factor YidD [Acidobacteriota bacterium]